MLLLLRQVEAKAIDILGSAKVVQFSEATVAENASAIEKLCHEFGVPSTFKLQAWRADTEWRLWGSAKYPESSYAHLRGGVHGSFMDLQAPGFTPFVNFPELIALMGEGLAAGRQISARQQSAR